VTLQEIWRTNTCQKKACRLPLDSLSTYTQGI
jgi:hypothetical protein